MNSVSSVAVERESEMQMCMLKHAPGVRWAKSKNCILSIELMKLIRLS
jgi:hypothetical protein